MKKRLNTLVGVGLTVWFLNSGSLAVQNQTHPNSPVTKIRDDTYMDALHTLAHSTWTIKTGAWEPFISTWTFVNTDQNVTGYTKVGLSSTSSTWTAQQYTEMVIETAVNHMIMQVADEDMEVYMVLNSSYNDTGGVWIGFCSRVDVNGKVIAIRCP